MLEAIDFKKDEIVNKITKDKNFTTILKCYKTEKTSAYCIDFYNEYKNGLVDKIYGITIDDKLINILVPVFSTEKTITWNFSYLKTIRSILPAEHRDLEDHELVDLIKCPLYYFDKYTGETIFLSLVSLKDWIDNGNKGKNGFSVYFWNDKLPNKYAISKKALKSDIFVKSLPFYKDNQLKSICKDFATEYHAQFANVSARSSQTVIKNITDGLYAQIKVYLYLLKEGYTVRMDWSEGDDLGIDIQLYIQNTWLNIDVKSTKTTDLKISKNRKETDFYAVCTWDKSDVILKGFLFKFDFWKSDILGTNEPEYIGDMYSKSLASLKKQIVKIDNIFTPYHNYQKLKMKRGERLFNAQ